MANSEQPVGGWTIGVTGANGNFGGMVLNELLLELKWPASKLVAVCRDAEKGKQKWGQYNVEVRDADFFDGVISNYFPATARETRQRLVDAFRGVDRLLIIGSNILGDRDKQHANAIAAAVAAGVTHIMYTSVPDPPDREPPLEWVPVDDNATEAVLKSCGVGYSILGNNIWYDDMLDNVYRDSIENGVIYTTDVNGAVGHVSKRDCAEAAAKLLTADNPPSRKYQICGPSLVTRAQVCLSCRPFSFSHHGMYPTGIRSPRPCDCRSANF